MKTKASAILLVILCTVFTSIGQLLYKMGSEKLMLDFYALITNRPLILGLISYFVGAIILIIALKQGELSVLYPFISTSFIWVSLLSIRYLSEQMSALKWTGVSVILLGISCIGFGSSGRGGERRKKERREEGKREKKMVVTIK